MFKVSTWTQEMARLRAGPLIKKIWEHLESVASQYQENSSFTGYKMIMYSGHDLTQAYSVKTNLKSGCYSATRHRVAHFKYPFVGKNSAALDGLTITPPTSGLETGQRSAWQPTEIRSLGQFQFLLHF